MVLSSVRVETGEGGSSIDGSCEGGAMLDIETCWEIPPEEGGITILGVSTVGLVISDTTSFED